MEHLGVDGGRLILLFVHTVFNALMLHDTDCGPSNRRETFTPLNCKLRGNQ
jgi:hypothetical protein